MSQRASTSRFSFVRRSFSLRSVCNSACSVSCGRAFSVSKRSLSSCSSSTCDFARGRGNPGLKPPSVKGLRLAQQIAATISTAGTVLIESEHSRTNLAYGNTASYIHIALRNAQEMIQCRNNHCQNLNRYIL